MVAQPSVTKQQMIKRLSDQVDLHVVPRMEQKTIGNRQLSNVSPRQQIQQQLAKVNNQTSPLVASSQHASTQFSQKSPVTTISTSDVRVQRIMSQIKQSDSTQTQHQSVYQQSSQVHIKQQIQRHTHIQQHVQQDNMISRPQGSQQKLSGTQNVNVQAQPQVLYHQQETVRRIVRPVQQTNIHQPTQTPQEIKTQIVRPVQQQQQNIRSVQQQQQQSVRPVQQQQPIVRPVQQSQQSIRPVQQQQQIVRPVQQQQQTIQPQITTHTQPVGPTNARASQVAEPQSTGDALHSDEEQTEQTTTLSLPVISEIQIPERFKHLITVCPVQSTPSINLPVQISNVGQNQTVARSVSQNASPIVKQIVVAQPISTPRAKTVAVKQSSPVTSSQSVEMNVNQQYVNQQTSLSQNASSESDDETSGQSKFLESPQSQNSLLSSHQQQTQVQQQPQQLQQSQVCSRIHSVLIKLICA